MSFVNGLWIAYRRPTRKGTSVRLTKFTTILQAKVLKLKTLQFANGLREALLKQGHLDYAGSFAIYNAEWKLRRL